MHAKPTPSQEQLREAFEYNASQGRLLWRIRSGHARPKQVAGHLHKSSGYRVVTYRKVSYSEHRLIWVWHFGEVPGELDVDHINGKRTENWIENLRVLTRSENAQNRKIAHRNSRTGLLGVSPTSYGFIAQLCVNGKTIFKYHATTPEEAHERYLEAKRELHPANTL